MVLRMNSEVVLVRHARSVPSKPDGPSEFQRPLTAEGNLQAHGLVRELSARIPTTVVSSPYLRAVQTVRPLALALGLTVGVEHELREWDSGITPHPGYAQDYAESWASPTTARSGAESLQDLTVRAVAVLTLLADDHHDQVVVVGSHGTFVARALVGFGVPGIDWAFCTAMPMPAIFRVRFAEDQVTVTGAGL